MKPYIINALQIFGIGAISMLIGALWTRLQITNAKNVRQHAIFVAAVMAGLGMAAVIASRLFVGRSALDTVTWLAALWFFYFFLFWCGFRVCIGNVAHHDFGESSILSMQYTGETRYATRMGETQLPDAPTRPSQDVYIDSRGAMVQGKRPG
ncbi:MAG: hypothetical protein WCK83_10990 [Burkholderiales bacterium]|nr:hypothetical protein [Burkholderiales bacterium]